jgi:ankyrin repeat protein
MWLARVDPASEGDAVEIAKHLVAHGARLNVRDAYGSTAYKIASANGLQDLARYLKSVHAR